MVPALSYILIQLNLARCLTLHPGTRLPGRSHDVAQTREGVIDLEVLDPAPVELARQPLVTVEIDLHLEREPGLQLDVDQTQLAIHEVVIELQAFPSGRLDE